MGHPFRKSGPVFSISLFIIGITALVMLNTLLKDGVPAEVSSKIRVLPACGHISGEDGAPAAEYQKKVFWSGNIFFLSVIVFAVLLFVFSSKPKADLPDTALASLIYCAGALAAVSSVVFIIFNLKSEYTSHFLSWTVSLVRGYPLYYGGGCGPFIYRIYPPLAPLVYLPAAAFAAPVTAKLAGSAISSLFYFLPVALLFLHESREKGKRGILGFYGLAFFALYTALSAPLVISAYRVDADGPMLGLSAAACLMLYMRKDGEEGKGLIIASSIFAVLAIWTKQTALPIVAALALYLLVSDGIRALGRFFFGFIISGACISAFFIWLAGFKNLALNIILIPSRHPLAGGSLLFDSPGSHLIFLAMNFVFPLMLLGALCGILAKKAKSPFRPAPFFRENRWLIFALAGICMAPMSFINVRKIGSSFNVYSYGIYFIVLSLALLLTRLLNGRPSLGNIHGGRAVKKVCFIFLAVLVVAVTPKLWRLYKTGEYLRSDKEKTAYEFMLEHPGEFYFVHFPLACILADGKLYHTLSGVRERDWANMEISRECIHAHMPPRARYVAFSKNPHQVGESFMNEYLPGFPEVVEVKGLEGWYIYGRRPGR